MKRFLIQLSEEESYYDPKEQVFYLYKEEYTDFYGILNELEIINDFNKNIFVSCDICGSFYMDARTFYYSMNKVIDLMDNQTVSLDKYPYRDILYDDLLIICSHLIEVRLFSDEEWEKYLTIGMPDIDVVKENNKEITDNDGNLFIFVYDELGLLIDKGCSCHSIIVQ